MAKMTKKNKPLYDLNDGGTILFCTNNPPRFDCGVKCSTILWSEETEKKVFFY